MIESQARSPQQHQSGLCEHGGGGSVHTSAQGVRGTRLLSGTTPALAITAKSARRIEDLTNMFMCSGGFDISL